MASSKVVTSRPSSMYIEDGEDEVYLENIPEEEQERTRVVLYEFLDESCKADKGITHEQRNVIHESAVQRIREDASSSLEECAVTKIVKILQNHGDEFQRRIEEDEVLQKASTTAMEGTDNSSQSNVVTRVLSHLKTVIGGLFEVDENGERVKFTCNGHWDAHLKDLVTSAQNISLGRISAIFYYCYSVCKNFVAKYFSERNAVKFLFSLGTTLITFLARVKFYQWLEKKGGWLQALVSLFPSNSWSQFLLGSPADSWPNNLMLIGGITLIGIWAYNRYIS